MDPAVISNYRKPVKSPPLLTRVADLFPTLAASREWDTNADLIAAAAQVIGISTDVVKAILAPQMLAWNLQELRKLGAEMLEGLEGTPDRDDLQRRFNVITKRLGEEWNL